MKKLFTTFGSMGLDETGLVLPHEHIFTDLRTPDTEGAGKADKEDVIKKMVPFLHDLQRSGVSVLIECTPEGVGRRPDILKAVSEAADFPLVIATGIYREPWVPKWVYDYSTLELADWMTKELAEGIGDTGVKAGFIKVSANDDEMTSVEKKILRAAARASLKTDALIASHTVKGKVVSAQLEILRQEGVGPDRFVWVHTQAEPDIDMHYEMAARGVWIEYDGIGWSSDEEYINLIAGAIEKGFISNLLISQDAGWYDPAKENGGEIKPYDYICKTFLGKLKSAGISDSEIDIIMHQNPFNAFSRQTGKQGDGSRVC